MDMPKENSKNIYENILYMLFGAIFLHWALLLLTLKYILQ